MKTVCASLSALLLLAFGSEALCPLGHGQVFEAPVSHAGEPDVTESAQVKFDHARAQIRQTKGTHAAWPTPNELGGFFAEEMNPTEDWSGDEVPEDGAGKMRRKFIHSVGASAEARIAWKPNHYTGLFQGAERGFVRLSTGPQPDYSQESSMKGNFAPGFSAKFYRDGVNSGNILGNVGPKPNESWNYFHQPLSNHVGGANFTNPVADKFATASKWTGFIGLNEFARHTETGERVSDEELNFPFQLLYHPDSELTHKFRDSGVGLDLYNTQLRYLSAGQHIFSIYAKDTRLAPQVHIGDIYITSEFVESTYADKELFMQHTRFEDDLKLRPDIADGCVDPASDLCKVCPLEVDC